MTYGICTDYNGKDKEKTVMETVSCAERQQRAGDGGSPVQVGTAEDHSGVSFPKVSPVGNDVFPTLQGTCIGAVPVQCNRWYNERTALRPFT